MEKEKTLKSIGHNIQLARLAKGLTQESLAEKCDVSTKYISALERGITSGSISLIIDICNSLEITPNYIFRDAINVDCLSNSIDLISKETLITYEKLKNDNKSFVNQTINHLYQMQKKR